MKLYDCKAVVNPRRVRMFLAEKGIEVDTVAVDVPGGEHHGDAFRRINPAGTVPALQLDDGAVLTEGVAIARYFEAVQPEPALLGRTPVEQAKVVMWQRRVADGLLDAATSYFHHATPGLGEAGRERIAAWGDASRRRVEATMRTLDGELTGRDHIAGPDFSFADITALCGVDIAAMLGIAIPDGCTHLKAWHARVSARPSAAA